MKQTAKIASLVSLFAAAALPARAATGTILIDGSLEDWRNVPIVPVASEDAKNDSPLGAIRFMKVVEDSEFLFVLLGFEAARPFDPPDQQAKLKPGVWDDFSYLEIDVNGDGMWDYRTRMVKGKRFGLNNMMLMVPVGTGEFGEILMHPEGTKDYFPLGPRAFFSPDSRAVEMRIPREPLKLTEGTIYLRSRVFYKDTRGGSGRWNIEYYPWEGRWVGIRLTPPAPVRDARGNLIPSTNRQLEPAIRRDSLMEVLTGDEPPFRSPLLYPRAPRKMLQRAANKAPVVGRGGSAEPVSMVEPRQGAVPPAQPAALPAVIDPQESLPPLTTIQELPPRPLGELPAAAPAPAQPAPAAPAAPR